MLQNIKFPLVIHHIYQNEPPSQPMIFRKIPTQKTFKPSVTLNLNLLTAAQDGEVLKSNYPKMHPRSMAHRDWQHVRN